MDLEKVILLDVIQMHIMHFLADHLVQQPRLQLLLHLRLELAEQLVGSRLQLDLRSNFAERLVQQPGQQMQLRKRRRGQQMLLRKRRRCPSTALLLKLALILLVQSYSFRSGR